MTMASMGPRPSPESVAASFVERNVASLGLRSGNAELHLADVTASRAGYHVMYQQVVDGVPVYGSMVNVFVDWGMVPRLAISGASEVRPDALVPAIDGGAVAAGLHGIGLPVSDPSLVLYPQGDTARLAWRVGLQDAGGRDWTVFASAVDGSVVAVLDADKQVTGSGRVFNPNPIVTSDDPSLRDNGDADSPVLDAQEVAVTLLGLDGSGYLRGRYVDVQAGKGPNAKEPSETFSYTRDDTRFEQVMAYYHVDRAMRYIDSLGFPGIVDHPQEVKVDQFAYDNSYYNTANKRISLGRGGVDDAEDADVILHEFGHAIQDREVPGFGVGHDAGSMGEGFGDYWAVTMHYSTTKAEWRPLVAMWDATSYDNHDPAYLRRVDLNLHYPADQTGEIHDDGQIWSRVLWDMRLAFGGPTADAIILEAQALLTPTASFQDAGRALLAADGALFGGSHVPAITGFLLDRGFTV